MPGQPIMVFGVDGTALQEVLGRALARGLRPAIYTAGLFATGHDAANRAEVARHPTKALDLVGIALRGPRKDVEKVTKGLALHG